jgi:nucleoid-associated protein YgaU
MGLFDKKSSESLREKYQHAIQVAKSLRMQGAAEERDGKLHFNGTVSSDAEKNQIWNAIKTVPDWQKEVAADIRVVAVTPQQPTAPGAAQGTTGATPPAQTTTYTVQPGDTLSAIAKRFLGNASDYMEIFNANRDQLSDPDLIRPGQVLKIPQPAGSRS